MSALVWLMAWHPGGDKTLLPTNDDPLNTLRPRQNGRHFADDTCKCIFLNQMLEIRLIFHWSLFLRVEFTILHHWFTLWLGAYQATSHYLNQWWLDYRCIYASLGLNELTDAFIHDEISDKLKIVLGFFYIIWVFTSCLFRILMPHSLNFMLKVFFW